MAIASYQKDKDKNLLYPIASVGATKDIYPSVKRAMETAGIKDKVLNAFTDYVKLAQQGKCFDAYFGDHKGTAKEIVDCIIEYPKVIVERHLSIGPSAYDKAVDELEALGDLRLPFPKITIISGEKIDLDGITMDQNGTVNLIWSFFLFQHDDYISVQALFSRPHEIGDNYYVAHNILQLSNGQIKLSRPVPIDEAKYKYKLAEEDTISSMAYIAIIAIHMLTVSGGDIYMATPTPDQVAINRKRMNKGKKPLVEFRMITIDGNKHDTLKSLPQSTHASPRLHWRRGHWRTMRNSGKKVWIDPMLIGDEKNGKIIKDYAVGNYKEQRNVAVL
jgi:hypothetical protein